MKRYKFTFIDYLAIGCIVSFFATIVVGALGGKDIVLAVPLFAFLGCAAFLCLTSVMKVIGGD